MDFNNLNEEGFLKELSDFSNINNSTKDLTKKILLYKVKAKLVKIVVISDIHFGHKNCNIKKLQEIIDFVLNTKNCYCILLGDQTECATKSSIGMSTFEQSMDLGQQLDGLVDLFTPLADAKKILGINTGNHEYRLSQFSGLDPAQVLAKRLDVPFLGWQGYLAINVNGIIYEISSFHGVGGGCSKSAKINGMRKVENITDCDLYIVGHLHDLIDDTAIRYRFNYEKGILEPYERKYALCGSFLEYWGGYSEMKALSPAKTGSPLITLDGTKKEIKIY